MTDLEEAIQSARQALKATPKDHSDHARLLNNLGNWLGIRYSREGVISDLKEALKVTRQALDITPDDHPDRAKWLNNLGVRLGYSYEISKAMTDLNEAIQVTRLAINAAPKRSSDRAGRLNNLGIRLGDRFLRTGIVADLEEAILVTKEAISTTSDDYPDRAQWMNNLGVRLGNMYTITGEISCLNEAIQVTRQAIDAIPKDHPDRAKILNNLGNRLGGRYSRTGAICDLEEAIHVTQQAVNNTATSHPSQAAQLNSLGNRLGEKFARMGTITDLDEAIKATRQAVEATPKDHLDWAKRLNSLGIRLGERYARTGAIANLTEAIRVARQSIDGTPEDQPDRAKRLNNLGVRLGEKYERFGLEKDLEEAIQVTRQAIYTTAQKNPLEQARWLNNLGIRLGDRFLRKGTVADLEEAILVTKEAISITPEDHPDRARWMNNLGVRLGNMYTITGEISCLNEAIQVTQQAIDATPKDHPDRAKRLKNLGDRLMDRHSKEKTVSVREEAIQAYSSALHQKNAPTMIRILAGRSVLRYSADASNWNQANKDSATAVHLIPRLTSRSLENSDRQHVLSQITGLACDATAISLLVGQRAAIALDLLETGRGLLAKSIEDIRADVSDLQAKHPQLANSFINLRDELEHSTLPSPFLLEGDGSYPTVPNIYTRYETGRKFDELITKIQEQPDSQSFLRPTSEEEIQNAARCGPIVVVNVSEHRCDAIIIERYQIRSLRLSNLIYDDIKEKVLLGRLGSPRTLEWLWDVVASPVLGTLGFTKPPHNDDWPHVWWIPTGLLSKFPLHAAGYHNNDSNMTVLDRVMSSYSSSINAIIHGRQRRNLQDASNPPDRALFVALQDTPNQLRLHFAEREVNMLYDLCGSLSLHSVRPKKLKEDVVSQLPGCKIFHFAGHGHTDSEDPSHSSLLLEDWESDPLTVADLLEMNLRERTPFLAYLSACGTGEIKDEKFFDESIHLISACQLAGFRHVIGTLWEVNDENCVDMAMITYEKMMHGGWSDESVCLGLHKATRKLRDRWLRASIKVRHRKELAKKSESGIGKTRSRDERDSRLPRNVNPCDSDEEDGPLHWVPYVHFGI